MYNICHKLLKFKNINFNIQINIKSTKNLKNHVDKNSKNYNILIMFYIAYKKFQKT